MIFHLFLKAYAVTAIMKIYAFEIAARRKVDMLPEVGFQTLWGQICYMQMHAHFFCWCGSIFASFGNFMLDCMFLAQHSENTLN